MNLSSGYPFWLIRDGISYDYPKLEKNTHADVVVLGGGISGALTAYFLWEAGINCMVVDGRTIGLGSTCASTSLLQYELDTPLSKLKEMAGSKNAERSYALCADSIHELAAIAKQTGLTPFSAVKSMYYAASEKHIPFLLAEFDARQKMGINIEWIDGDMLLKKHGVKATAAVLSEPAAQTDAYAFTHTLLQHCCSKGMKVYDRTYIAKKETGKRGLLLTTREGVTIRCKKLVYATGYEAVQYIPQKIVKLSSTYAVASEQQSHRNILLEKEMILWSTADPYLYARATGDNRIIIGGRDEDFYSPGRRDALLKQKSRQLVRDFGKVMPVTEFVPEFRWAGTFGSTKDGLPYIGEHPTVPHCLFALGFGGNGITFSLIAAKLVRDILTRKINRDTELFSFSR